MSNVKQLTTTLLKHDWQYMGPGPSKQVVNEVRALTLDQLDELLQSLQDDYFPSWQMDLLSKMTPATAIRSFISEITSEHQQETR